MDSRKKKILSWILAIAVLVTVIPATAVLATSKQGAQVVKPPKPTNISDATVAPSDVTITMADYKVIAESDTYKMHFYEPRLSVILENKETGEMIESTLSDAKDDGTSNEQWRGYMKSGIALSLIEGTVEKSDRVDLLSDPHLLEVTYTDNGFSAFLYFTQYEIAITVEAYLDGDEFVVNVPDESIVEYKDTTYVASVELFPFMGYTYLDEQDGYMFIPDGNGALIHLDDKHGKYSTGFTQMIYGNDAGFVEGGKQSLLWEQYDTVIDANKVLAPVFGMAHTEEQMAYLAIVEDGDERAAIVAEPNGVLSLDYNRCFARFILRDVYVQPLNQSNSGTVKTVEADRYHSDLTVRYLLLSGDDADYSGMANAYRDYLLENKLVSEKDTSYNTRVDFLGSDQEEFLMGTTAVVMTTTDNIETMYNQLQKAGVPSLLTIYKGWQKGGVYALPISSYNVEGKIGGKKALTNLIKESAKEDYNIYLYNDALRMNGRTNLVTFDAMKMINKRTFMEESNEQVYDTFYYLMPSKSQEKLSNFVKNYTKSGVKNLALAGVSNNIFSYSSRGEFYGRNETASVYADAIADIDSNTNLILEQPFAYLWNNTEAFLDMPLGSSEYMYIDEEVPFLSMVLKGILPMYSDYVNFEADKTEFFLQMVESGVYPSFYLTYENSSNLIYTNSSDLYSTQFSIYKDTVVEYDKELRAVAKEVEGAHIIDHEKVKTDVVKVTYDNGVVIYVNYSESNVTVDGVKIDALSYKVGEA